jgi:hypothetical protein
VEGQGDSEKYRVISNHSQETSKEVDSDFLRNKGGRMHKQFNEMQQ